MFPIDEADHGFTLARQMRERSSTDTENSSPAGEGRAHGAINVKNGTIVFESFSHFLLLHRCPVFEFPHQRGEVL
jgi:hypothetical protein